MSRLTEIEARDAEVILCGTSCPSPECKTENDRRYLLEVLKQRDAALARVESECTYLDGLAEGDQHYARVFRAAVRGVKA